MRSAELFSRSLYKVPILNTFECLRFFTDPRDYQHAIEVLSMLGPRVIVAAPKRDL